METNPSAEVHRDDLRILQCAKDIRPGGGVCGVAHELEGQFSSLGVPSSRFTLRSLGPTQFSGRAPRSLILRKLALLWDVVFFSTVGTLVLALKTRRQRGVVTITHDDALVGDILINHGLHRAMLLNSGHPWRMLLRNPLHPFLLVREWIRFRLRIHRRVVCFSESEAALLLKHYPRASGRVEIISNGVDLDRFYPNESAGIAARVALGIGKGDFAIIFVGHEFERKGLAILIDAVSSLPAHVKLLVVGDVANGAARPYRELATAKGLQDRVRFLGRRTDVAALINGADTLVMPTAFESWALVGLEAMACGVPVLMPLVGGIAEYLRDGENGLVIERNAADVARKIRRLLEDPQLRSRLGTRARETALAFSWPKVAKQYVDLATKVLRERQAADARR